MPFSVGGSEIRSYRIRFCRGLVGRHLRGRRFLGGSSVPLCQPFSVGGSEIRPYRIRFCRGLGRAASPRPPLSRWELCSALPAVLGGRLGDPPLPNSLLPGVARAASPRPPLSRWELCSALPAVLSGRLGDPPLPNPLLPGVGRAASPRPPLSRRELCSALPAVLGGRLGDPPLPNPSSIAVRLAFSSPGRNGSYLPKSQTNSPFSGRTPSAG